PRRRASPARQTEPSAQQSPHRTVSRLHAVLAELVEGGMPRQLKAKQARAVLAGFTPTSPVQAARHALALDHLDDFERIEAQLAEHRKRITEAAAGSAVSDLY